MDPEPLLQCESLQLRIADTVFCSGLNLSLSSGQSLGILGRNGAGKTTLLHTLMHLREPDAGNITLTGKPINQWTRRELAQRIGILFQHTHDEMPATVMETALLGRYPHSAMWRWEDPQDIAIARQALQDMGLADLAERSLASLSGGERQRLAIAMLLTQNPSLFLLDEPSNHLDIAYQIHALSLLRNKIRENDAGLIMASHDINLVARFCDQVLLFTGKGEFLLGPAREILQEENLSRAYDCAIRALRDARDDQTAGTENTMPFFMPG